MIETSSFFSELLKLDICFFSGVPDSLLRNICSYINDNVPSKNHIIAANEGGALSLGMGYHLATGKIPLIYMQNSGLGNIVNPALSLLDPEINSIPALLMIGWRGQPGMHDEPQHIKQGKVTLSLLESMGIPYVVIGPDDNDVRILNSLAKMVKLSQYEKRCCAIVIKKDTFFPYKIKKPKKYERPLKRKDVIKILVDDLDDQDIVIASTGITSRELFDYRALKKSGHQRDFLTVGAMGFASQIALGVALSKPNRRVYCVDGDGALLMHMGGLPIIAANYPKNLRHILLNNAAHDSVGGQPTVGDLVDFVTY